MNKIKFDTVAMSVIIILVVVLIILHARKHFDSARKRISELEEELKHELEKLNINKERQKELTSKAIKSYQMILGFTFVTFCLVIGVSIGLGMSYADALEVNVGTVGLALAMISVVVYDTWNPDALLKALKEKIKIWTYKKYGFDPNEIELAQLRIDDLNGELEKERESLLVGGMTLGLDIN